MNNLFEKIKKTLTALLSVLAVLFSFGTEKIEMDIQVQYAPEQTICVEWTNLTATTVHSPRYSLEKQTDGTWAPVAFAESFGFKEIASVHYPLQGGSFTVNCGEVFGKTLAPGTYRFNFEYTTADGAKVAQQEFAIFAAPTA